MKTKYSKSVIAVMVALVFIATCFCFSRNDNAEYQSPIINNLEDSSFNLIDYLQAHISPDGHTNAKELESHPNLDLYWSDYLVSIEQYDLWSDINYDNYGEINEPFVDQWDDKDIVIIDSTTFYYVIKSDSVFIDQEVFTDNIEGKIVHINSLKNTKDTNFKLSVAVDETITQFLPLEEYGRDGMEEKESKLETWQKVSLYKTVEDSAQYTFRIPDRDSISDIKQIKIDLALRDTCLFYEAEGGGHDVNYIYKGKPAEHRIKAMLIRIEKYKKNSLIETKYIRISFPEAC